MPSLSSQNKTTQDNDILLVDKPVGLTSFGVVARIRRRLSIDFGRKIKVGHAGTLDPFATGLLIILTGAKCREASQFLKLDKSYQATLVLGKTTPTLDPEGRQSFVGKWQPSYRQVERVLSSFLGETEQVPPDFSALKVAGRRAYDLARQGRALDLPARPIKISQISIVNYEYPLLKISVSVSSGTYIRSLARDIGTKLGTGAYCYELRRTQIGEYSVEKAHGLGSFGIDS